MERPRIATRALLIAGLSIAGAFGSPARSETAPPNSDNCRIIQTKGDEIIVVCPYPYRPEAAIERVKEKCMITGQEVYNHRSTMRAWLKTSLQKNCWGPSLKDYIRTVIKNPPKIPVRLRR